MDGSSGSLMGCLCNKVNPAGVAVYAVTCTTPPVLCMAGVGCVGDVCCYSQRICLSVVSGALCVQHALQVPCTVRSTVCDLVCTCTKVQHTRRSTSRARRLVEELLEISRVRVSAAMHGGGGSKRWDAMGSHMNGCV